MPVSRTEISSSAGPSQPVSEPPEMRATLSAISPSAVNLMALLSKFTRICRSRVTSLTMASGTSGSIQ